MSDTPVNPPADQGTPIPPGAAQATTQTSAQGQPAAQQPTAVDPKILLDFGLTAQQITDTEQKYSIPQSVKDAFPDLIALLIKTESMNNEEREYWFQVLPIMNDDQIVKLRNILVNERDQLKKIDNEYNQEIQKIGEIHKKEWNAFEAQEKKKALLEQERQHEEAEKKAEEELLSKLDDTASPNV